MKLCCRNGSISESVLIDTWWNVNDAYNASSMINVSVLIDTWWNVNYQEVLETMILL